MGPVTLYRKHNFHGDNMTIGEGRTRFLATDEFNDKVMSIRVAEGYCAVLYEHANDNGGYGASVDLLEDCSNLSKYGFDNRTSFIWVFKIKQGIHIYVRGSIIDGTYVAGHWERERASGVSSHGGSEAIVSPPHPPPTVPQPHTVGGPIIRDHRNGQGGAGGITVDRVSAIKHVFVLVLENRSFDHMLGFSGITGTDAESKQPTSIDGLTGTESNSFNGISYTVSRGAPDVAPFDPWHGLQSVVEQLCVENTTYENGKPYPTVKNAGFVANYAKSHPELPDGAMKCFTPDQVPVITALAKEFVVCDRWFCSMPGPTEPNRWFIHAATAGPFDDTPKHHEFGLSMLNPFGGFEFERGSIFGLLKKHGVKYRIYAGDEFPNVALLDGVSRTWDVDDFDDFAEDVASPDYDAAYTFIEPSYDVFSEYSGGTSQHPLGSAKAGEMLIKRTYEALRKSPIWGSSMLIITYDEHGGFYDHVRPPSAVATGSKGRTYGFTFEQLGPRVPAIVISPLIPKNLIDHRQYEHSSIISTLIELFRLEPLTARSSASSGLQHLATLRAPRDDAPMTLPDPMGSAVARIKKFSYLDVTADRPEVPLSDDPTGSIAATIRSGLAQHLEVAPPSDREAIVARVKALKTHGEALQYLKEVSALVQSARNKAGVKRSATVRTVVKALNIPGRRPIKKAALR